MEGKGFCTEITELQGNASLARAYRLFRTMGLHHLLIGPARPPVIGIITRKVPHIHLPTLPLSSRGCDRWNVRHKVHESQDVTADLRLQDMTEEVAEVLLGKKANEGLISQVG